MPVSPGAKVPGAPAEGVPPSVVPSGGGVSGGAAPQGAAVEAGGPVTILSVNVTSLGCKCGYQRLAAVLERAAETRADFVAIQETRHVDPRVGFRWAPRLLLSHGWRAVWSDPPPPLGLAGVSLAPAPGRVRCPLACGVPKNHSFAVWRGLEAGRRAPCGAVCRLCLRPEQICGARVVFGDVGRRLAGRGALPRRGGGGRSQLEARLPGCPGRRVVERPRDGDDVCGHEPHSMSRVSLRPGGSRGGAGPGSDSALWLRFRGGRSRPSPRSRAPPSAARPV